MASLQKRGRYYYGRWTKTVGEKRVEVKKSLGIRYIDKAKDALEKLKRLEQYGRINPFSADFDPQESVKRKEAEQKLWNKNNEGSSRLFYKKKDHLSNSTVNLEGLKPEAGMALQAAKLTTLLFARQQAGKTSRIHNGIILNYLSHLKIQWDCKPANCFP